MTQMSAIGGWKFPRGQKLKISLTSYNPASCFIVFGGADGGGGGRGSAVLAHTEIQLGLTNFRKFP